MNQLKNLFLFLCLLLVTLPSFGNDKKKTDTLIYKGAFFEAEYPKNFTVKPSILSNIPDQFDSAFFISPDKKVKFYVYSPQWSGEATDIAIDPKLEVEKDTKTETKNKMKHKWYTYESKDGKLRSYQETTNEEETTKLIVGIEYSNREAYKKYKNEYLQFKKSIKQFAD